MKWAAYLRLSRPMRWLFCYWQSRYDRVLDRAVMVFKAADYGPDSGVWRDLSGNEHDLWVDGL